MSFTPSYDETREPLEVFAIDEKMNRATGSIPYRSLRWVRRYCEPGEFEMVVPADIYNPTWAFVYTDSRPEMGIIQKVEYQDDSQVYGGIDSVTLSGYFFEVVLNNIVFLVESPEEQKVYVPEPKRPYFQHSKNDSKVYTDGVGTYYYQNKSGTYTNATTGKTFTNADGLTEVDYKPAYGNMHGNPDVGITSYDYYTDSSHEQVTVVPYNPDAGTKTYDILFEDDRGNAYYLNDHGRVTQAVGVVDSYGDTYTARKRSWNALDGDEYGKYYTVTVKGPWQRTDALEPITEGDSVEIVLNWARRMMGDWILYEEPEIEGVQKAVDPSFQYLGDLLYSTLWEVGASLRLEYLFDKNIFILSVYRGFDRTQIEDAEPVAAMALPTTLAEVETLSDGPVLPSGYTELEYIQSSGTQYIRLDFTPDSDTRVVLDHQLTDTSGTYAMLGSRTSTTSADVFSVFVTNGQLRTDYAANEHGTFTATTSRETLDKDGRVTKYNGKTSTLSAATFTCPRPMVLFSVQNVSGTQGFVFDDQVDNRPVKMRLYSCQIYDGDTLARDLVPARRQSDSAVGLYDTVTGTFYGNAGTGAFAAGPEVKYPAKLTYYPNSTTATGTVAAQEGYVGDSVTVAQNGYTDPNKTFLHWGTLPTGGTTYQPGSSYVLTGMTDALYAQWQDNKPEPPEPTPTGGKAPWAVFSDTWGTIYGYDAIRDESNYKNTCFTLYEYDKPSGFDPDGLPSASYRKVFADTPSGDGVYNLTGVEVFIPYTTVRGYHTSRIGEDDEPDIETYLDLRSEKPSCDNQWSRESVTIEVSNTAQIPAAVEEGRAQLLAQGDGSAPPTESAYEAWDQDLQTRGVNYLNENYGVETTLDTGTVNTRDYLKGWDLGDLVEFEVSTVGLAEQARITEVEEVYESGRVSINITVGDSQLVRTKTGGA